MTLDCFACLFALIPPILSGINVIFAYFKFFNSERIIFLSILLMFLWYNVLQYAWLLTETTDAIISELPWSFVECIYFIVLLVIQIRFSSFKDEIKKQCEDFKNVQSN